jgi:signal transduction histidine kinase
LLRPSRLIQSESFRLAVAYAGLFLALTAVLLVAVLWIVQRTQMAVLRGANDADIVTIENGYADEGRDEAVEVVKQIVGPQRRADTYPVTAFILLQDDSAGKLAGNLPSFSPREGSVTLPVPDWAEAAWRHHRLTRPGESFKAEIAGRGTYIAPGVYAFVGRSTHQLYETRVLILEAFLWIACGALLLGGAGGVRFGVRFLGRVDSITRTCEAIIAGRFNERIPAGAGSNEWDRLARAINEMLNRIESLLENLRQVSSDVAHDLRTPLTRLRTRLEQARLRSHTMPEFDSAVANAIEDTDQLLALFSALLRLAQIESAPRSASLSALSLSDLLERVFHLYQPVAEDRQQQLSGSIDAGVSVLGDTELLTQMFSNLVENALRHTPAGSHITIGLSLPDATAWISDDGPGIPESERGKVFRRFYQLSGSRSNGGHGLGLSLVAAIASLHSATVTLADAGPGLTVRVRFARASPGG